MKRRAEAFNLHHSQAERDTQVAQENTDIETKHKKPHVFSVVCLAITSDSAQEEAEGSHSSPVPDRFLTDSVSLTLSVFATSRTQELYLRFPSLTLSSLKATNDAEDVTQHTPSPQTDLPGSKFSQEAFYHHKRSGLKNENDMEAMGRSVPGMLSPSGAPGIALASTDRGWLCWTSGQDTTGSSRWGQFWPPHAGIPELPSTAEARCTAATTEA